MALNALFSVTPLTPKASTYDPANPSAPHAVAFLSTDGGHTSASAQQQTWRDLSTQYKTNEIILGGGRADPTTTVYHGDSGAWVAFKGHNVTRQHQYLFVIHLEDRWGEPWAQIFVGNVTTRVFNEKLNGDKTKAVLVDCPGDGVYLFLGVQLARPQGASAPLMGFKGIDCYLV